MPPDAPPSSGLSYRALAGLQCALVLVVLVLIRGAAATTPRIALWVEWWALSLALPWFGIIALGGEPRHTPKTLAANIAGLLLLVCALGFVVAPSLQLTDRVQWSWLLPLLLCSPLPHVGLLLVRVISPPRAIADKVADWLLLISFALAVVIALPTPLDDVGLTNVTPSDALPLVLGELLFLTTGWLVPVIVLVSELVRSARLSARSRLHWLRAVGSWLALCVVIAAPWLGITLELHWHDRYLSNVLPSQLVTVPLITVVVLRVTAPMQWDSVVAGLVLLLAAAYLVSMPWAFFGSESWPSRAVDLMTDVIPVGSSPRRAAGISELLGWCWAGALAARVVHALLALRRRQPAELG